MSTFMKGVNALKRASAISIRCIQVKRTKNMHVSMPLNGLPPFLCNKVVTVGTLMIVSMPLNGLPPFL